MTVKVKIKQTWFDLSIHYTGSVHNAFDIALANGQPLSSTPVPGSTITIPDTLSKQPEVMQYLQARGIEPATGFAERFSASPELDYLFPGVFPLSL